MDYLSLIKLPIEAELADFIDLFNKSLMHSDGLLSQVLDHIRQRAGKRMRPILILLMARNFGKVSSVTQHSAVGLELLHTASLVHDDVVDESGERRGQASVNATYNNKVAVLVGDFILSTALLHVSYSHSEEIVRYLAELGRILSNGEILQLNSISNEEISEDIYYQVIKQKTAALFEACAGIGAISANASELQIEEAKRFGQNLGIIFQIRDDIFDYYDSKEIGKPTGNDMVEGKLTLPVIYALKSTGDEEMMKLARKVKAHTVTADEIAQLVAFTKENGGIEYADKRMWDFHAEAMNFLDTYVEDKANAARRTVLCFFFQTSAGQHKGDDHHGSIEISVPFYASRSPYHFSEEGVEGAEEEGDEGAECYERIHVCRMMQKLFPSGNIKLFAAVEQVGECQEQTDLVGEGTRVMSRGNAI